MSCFWLPLPSEEGWGEGRTAPTVSGVGSRPLANYNGFPSRAVGNADRGSMERFTEGRWATAAAFDWERAAGRLSWSNIGRGLRTVNDSGPPWIISDRVNNLVVRLDYGPQFKDLRLKIVPLADLGRSTRLKVRDAIAWSKSEVLLATDRGLRTFAMDGAQLAVPPLNTERRAVPHRARDRSGALPTNHRWHLLRSVSH